MKITVCCATHRGCEVLQQLFDISPRDDYTVFASPPSPCEPDYLPVIRAIVDRAHARLFETTAVHQREFQHVWEQGPPDLMFLVHWRYMIPMSIVSSVKNSCVVFHDSLLPGYRGFSPTNWTIINGESSTGASMFHAAEQVDAGDLIDQIAVPIKPNDTVREVMKELTQAYLTLLNRNFDSLKAGIALRRPQDHSKATFTCRLLVDDFRIDWSLPTERIFNLIRAVSAPYRGAFTEFAGKELTVWSAERIPEFRRYVGRVAGRIVESIPGTGSVILTGDGVLLLREVQIAGSGAQCASDLLRAPNCQLGHSHSSLTCTNDPPAQPSTR